MLLILLLALPFTIQGKKTPVVYAHRGCWLGSVIPENSVAAVEMAARYGYPVIECDVHYTKDSVMVLMHDFNDMRRCIRRRADNSKLDKKLKLSDITFNDLRANYVLASDDPNYRTPVPTLEELLTACKQYGVKPMLHSDLVPSYRITQDMLGDNWIAFCSTLSALQEARKMSKCTILLSQSDGTAAKAIADLKKIGGHCGISSMNYNMMTASFCDSLRKAGFEVQSSIFPTPHDAEAIRNGVSILLSDFCYLPNKQKRPDVCYPIKAQQLHKGDTVEQSGDAITYGANVLKLTFQGTLEVTLNDRTYLLTRETMGTEYLGLRFFRTKPLVKINAKETSRLGKSQFMVYKF